MKQTAVEWFVEEFFNHSRISTFHTGEQEEVITLRQFDEVVEKAKEIEKEQIRTIVLAYQEERNGRSDGAQNQWEPYEADEFLENYNKTFNTKEK